MGCGPNIFWAIYNDISRRLVTPNGGDCKEIPPNMALNQVKDL